MSPVSPIRPLGPLGPTAPFSPCSPFTHLITTCHIHHHLSPSITTCHHSSPLITPCNHLVIQCLQSLQSGLWVLWGPLLLSTLDLLLLPFLRADLEFLVLLVHPELLVHPWGQGDIPERWGVKGVSLLSSCYFLSFSPWAALLFFSFSFPNLHTITFNLGPIPAL